MTEISKDDLADLLAELDRPIVDVRADKMKDKRHTILVKGYAFGQFRIQVTDIKRPCSFAPPGHGAIVRQL